MNFSKLGFSIRVLVGRMVNTILKRAGLRLIQTSAEPQFSDVGRTYEDPLGTVPHFKLRPGTPKTFAEAPTIFTINNGSETLEEEVFWSHLTLLKFLKHFEFETVLDIGSHEQKVSRIFRHLGKKVTTVEIAPGFQADYKEDYLKIKFPEKFDAIWCSQTLEHQRNVGQFVDKLLDDLRDGGILALTVPYDLGTNLTFSHCNCFTPLLLMYHLVLAGFDCREASLKCYNYNIGIIVKKKYNGIQRYATFALQPNSPDKQEFVILDGKKIRMREIIGDEIFDDMAAAFPFPIEKNYLVWNNRSINWGDPI